MKKVLNYLYKFRYIYGGILFLGTIGFIYRLLNLDVSLQFHLATYALSVLWLISVWELVHVTHIKLDDMYPFEKNFSKRAIIQILLTAVVIYCMRYIFFEMFIEYLPKWFDRKLIFIVYTMDFFIGLIVNLGICVITFFQLWKASLLRTVELEKEKALVQYENLRNQLNPHFFFNSLTTLDTLIHDNPDLASKYVQQLSKLFRYMLSNQNKDSVGLAQEMEVTQQFLFLLKTRYDGALQFEIKIKDDDLLNQIVPATLINLIENAIKHNVVLESKPLHIKIEVIDMYLLVHNNKQLKQQVETSNGHGLRKLSEFYEKITNKKIEIDDQNDSFTVKVPLL